MVYIAVADARSPSSGGKSKKLHLALASANGGEEQTSHRAGKFFFRSKSQIRPYDFLAPEPCLGASLSRVRLRRPRLVQGR